MSGNLNRQQIILDWFNHTYRTKGFHYLRPEQAYYVFLEILNARPGQSILDVACGPARFLKAAADYGLEPHGVDLSDVAIEMARAALPNADLRVANAEQLPFKDGMFDHITCIGSLERMLDISRVLAEIKRVSKTDAELCFMVRNSNHVSWKHVTEKLGLINEKGHQGANSLDSWHASFVDAGFRVREVYPDLWPTRRWAHWLSFGGKLFAVDYRSAAKKSKKLETAYEFIFHLTIE